ncbi:NADP-dependent phosphogluconate dehydrogenase [Echinicola marina]|uniref:NADP-dependent phosphogluconate dehydrogenase n=1 Tax=Echinicola marina TaxID=2859768 RepID=UPI001CF634D7|nr:NADP-dependent phosphogluconate dehydrogenase [Echinicola marina]UCS93878.1 NADP-dependent phosphogluconate dehydrogenase [Echinicola marina]
MIILLMGVSGSGKTTVGKMLSEALKLPFYDADDFHPEENIQKMRAGIPLNDLDRKPWLETLSVKLSDWEKEGGAILACSALKEAYRSILVQYGTLVDWFFLRGQASLIEERMESRQGHYMPTGLLASQLETLEIPRYAQSIDISQTPEKIVKDIMSNLENKKAVSSFGIIGMGVMGSSLALNLAEQKVKVSVYNRTLEGVEEDVAKKLVDAHPEVSGILPFDKLDEFVESLAQPRKILMMIPAGQIIDQQIARLLRVVDKGDVIIDGGNSFFEDSNKRVSYLASQGIHYVAMGISGGQEGARKGPALMPGGSKEGYELIKPFMEKIAAKDKDGKPCMHYVGPDGAGHFVKMVHNSIEYGEMQALSELYAFMRNGLAMAPEEIIKSWKAWTKSGSGSYLLDISMDILAYKEEGELLLDKILDQAEQKGTGGWSVGTASKYGVPYAPLTAAVTTRVISSLKEKRMALAQRFPREYTAIDKEKVLNTLKGAYDMTRLITHEIGFSLIKKVGEKEKWDFDFSEIARNWTQGCIIRSTLMEELVEVFKQTDSLLTAPELEKSFKKGSADLAELVGEALKAGIAMPVMSASINYFFALTTANSSANLIQAQRDYFGAHKYRKVGEPEDLHFHTDWKSNA